MQALTRYLLATLLLLSGSIGSNAFFSSVVADEPAATVDSGKESKQEQQNAETGNTAQAKAEEADTEEGSEENTEENTEEIDDLVVPDGTVEELFAFIDETMRGIRARDRSEIPAAARAIADAGMKIRTIEGVTTEEEVKAVRQQMNSLSFLMRSDGDAKREYDNLIESLAAESRPELKAIADQQMLQAELRALRSMSTEEKKAFITKMSKVLDASGASMETFSLGMQVAGAIQKSAPELALSVYDDLVVRLESSEDEKIQDVAERVKGSARQLRLVGNPIELTGDTDRGEPLDWDSFRGKVVLVDFWASWCGPCRGEVPNMKRNLVAYKDDFVVVGINMDNTEEAMRKYIASDEIQWVNIVGDAENGVGWNHPIARYYGVSGIPKAILVDREGLVVSLNARGKELDRLLAEMIGPLPGEEDEEEDEDDDSDEMEE